MQYNKRSGQLTFQKNVSRENLEQELRKFEEKNDGQYDWSWVYDKEELSFLVWIDKDLAEEDAKEVFDKLTK